MKQYKDQLDRIIQLSTTPKRIISLVPSLTELLCDLDLETSLVGITKFCVHPSHLRAKIPIVGGTKQIHYNRIKDLQPDIIICNKEENTPEIIQELEQFAPVHISDINNIEDCLEIIDMYGNLFEIQVKAHTIISKIRIKQNDFKFFCNGRPKHSVAYFIWKDPWMVVGRNTFINSMLGVNNFTNVFENHSRYPEIVMNKLYSETELVLLSSEPYPFKEAHIKILQPTFPNAKIFIVDGEMFSWYGSRLIKAFDYYKKLHEQLNNI